LLFALVNGNLPSQESLNQKFYKYKIVEPIFADETNAIIIITVKVYYSNEEAIK
jgi:hypothetical protein